MRKLIGFLVLAFTMLVPFRMVYLEVGKHANPVHVLLFLAVLVGTLVGILLIEDKTAKNEKH